MEKWKREKKRFRIISENSDENRFERVASSPGSHLFLRAVGKNQR